MPIRAAPPRSREANPPTTRRRRSERGDECAVSVGSAGAVAWVTLMRCARQRRIRRRLWPVIRRYAAFSRGCQARTLSWCPAENERRGFVVSRSSSRQCRGTVIVPSAVLCQGGWANPIGARSDNESCKFILIGNSLVPRVNPLVSSGIPSQTAPCNLDNENDSEWVKDGSGQSCPPFFGPTAFLIVAEQSSQAVIGWEAGVWSAVRTSSE